MSILGWLVGKFGSNRGTEPSIRYTARTISASVSRYDCGITTGRWVVHDGAVGVAFDRKPIIIQDQSKPDGAEDAVQILDGMVVHFTDEEGLTVRQDHVPLTELRIARYEEIPEPRRPEIGKAKAMGYA